MSNCNIGCMLCNQNLYNNYEPQRVTCADCGAAANILVPRDIPPYRCSSCSTAFAYNAITESLCAQTASDPVTIALKSMDYHGANTHSPEFFYLVGGSILAAHANADKTITLSNVLPIIRKQVANIPGGACSLWGSMGVCLSTSFAISIMAEQQGLDDLKQKLSEGLLLKTLSSIARSYQQAGGIQCCRRNTIIALFSTVSFVQDYLNSAMTYPKTASCSFEHCRGTCGRQNCTFFPRPDGNGCSQEHPFSAFMS